LEGQLLNLVIKHEIKEVEDKKELIVKNMYQHKEKLEAFKDLFIKEIINCAEPLIDNPHLSNKLEDIKLKINSCSTELKLSIESMTLIDQSRDIYKSVSQKGTLFYMSLYGLKDIDPLYQFSIDSFMKLFLNSIDLAKKDQNVLNRISNIINQLTNDVFEFSSISIYEKHYLLFLFQIACTLDKDAGHLLNSELIFFIKGNIIGSENVTIKNPTTWLSNKCWQNVVNLSTSFENFSNLIEHISNNIINWEEVNYIFLIMDTFLFFIFTS